MSTATDATHLKKHAYVNGNGYICQAAVEVSGASRQTQINPQRLRCVDVGHRARIPKAASVDDCSNFRASACSSEVEKELSRFEQCFWKEKIVAWDGATVSEKGATLLKIPIGKTLVHPTGPTEYAKWDPSGGVS